MQDESNKQKKRIALDEVTFVWGQEGLSRWIPLGDGGNICDIYLIDAN